MVICVPTLSSRVATARVLDPDVGEITRLSTDTMDGVESSDQRLELVDELSNKDVVTLTGGVCELVSGFP